MALEARWRQLSPSRSWGGGLESRRAGSTPGTWRALGDRKHPAQNNCWHPCQFKPWVSQLTPLPQSIDVNRLNVHRGANRESQIKKGLEQIISRHLRGTNCILKKVPSSANRGIFFEWALMFLCTCLLVFIISYSLPVSYPRHSWLLLHLSCVEPLTLSSSPPLLSSSIYTIWILTLIYN